MKFYGLSINCSDHFGEVIDHSFIVQGDANGRAGSMHRFQKPAQFGPIGREQLKSGQNESAGHTRVSASRCKAITMA